MTDSSTYTTDSIHEGKEDKRTPGEIAMITGGSVAEILIGVGAIVLAILGLVNIAPIVTLGVCSIAIGCGLIMQGTTISGAFSTLLRQTSHNQMSKASFGSGISKEFLGGLAGIGLGIAAIVGIIPAILMPIAAIVLGCTFIASSMTISKLNDLMVKYSDVPDASKEVANAAIGNVSGVGILVGLAAATLGIINLFTGVSATAATIVLIGLLVLAAGMFIEGVSLSGRKLNSVSVKMKM